MFYSNCATLEVLKQEPLTRHQHVLWISLTEFLIMWIYPIVMDFLKPNMFMWSSLMYLFGDPEILM